MVLGGECELFKSLNKEDEQEFEVLDGKLKVDLHVQSSEDAKHLFDALHFWGFADVVHVRPSEVTSFLQRGTLVEYLLQMYGDSPVQIPRVFYYRTSSVNVHIPEHTEFVRTCDTLAFWGVREVPSDMYSGLLHWFDHNWFPKYEEYLPELKVTYQYRSNHGRGRCPLNDLVKYYCPKVFEFVAHCYKRCLSSRHLGIPAEYGQLENFITIQQLMLKPTFALVPTAKIAANGHLHCKEHWPCLLYLLITAPHLAGPAFSKLAIDQDSTEHLQTALDAQCPLSAGMCDTALQHNSQACLRLLHQHGLCDWTNGSCELAVDKGLPLLQLTHELGCPLTDAGVLCAVQRNRVDCLSYLYR